MGLLESILYLLMGLFLLLAGGDVLVRAAADLALRLKISPSTIGLSIVAAGTSAPELLTSLVAAFEGAPDVAMGNIIGSNIFNILLVLGFSACAFPILLLGASQANTQQTSPQLRLKKKRLHQEYFALVGLSFLFVTLLYDHSLSQIEGGALVLLLGLLVALKLSQTSDEQQSWAEATGQVNSVFKKIFQVLSVSRYQFAIQNTLMLLLGCVGLVWGARLAIQGGVSVGELMGLSQRHIGLFIVSVGTSLPEIAASLMAARQKQNEIAVANVIGSNILNMLAVGGVTACLSPLKVEPNLLKVDALFMLGMTLMLAPLILLGRYRLTRLSGAVLLAFYAAYAYLALQA